MFFRRQRGEYRETDRVTRYKLIKSGKHWLRASTSLFGLFKVMRGGVDATQVKTELVEDQASQKLTALDLLKGVAATGTILGGFAATQTRVYANDTVAVEKTVESKDILATRNTVVLGETSMSDSETSASLSTSVSESTSLSESVSNSSSASASVSTSTSLSASISNSTSFSESVSASASASQSTSGSNVSVVSSLSVEQSGSTTAIDQQPSTSKEAKNLEIDSAELKTTEITGKNSVSGVQSTSVRTSLIEVAAVALASSEVTAKQQEENRKKLTNLSAEIGEYLAKAGGLPNTDPALAKANAAIIEIEKALTDPTSDLTTVVQKATLARNSIINAVLATNSGVRDVRNGTVITRGAHLRAASNPPTISMPSNITIYNDESVNYQIRLNDDKGMDKITASPSNAIITGLNAPDYPATKKRGYGDLYTYDRWGNQTGAQRTYTINVIGTVGRENGTWKPYKPGTYVLEYTVRDIHGLTATARTNVHIKGFNERHNPVSGDTVIVKNPSSLTLSERNQVLEKFKEKNQSLLSGSD
ncbi:MAG: accessory Sec-dependent serine-rich glycoprotein adhesin, partial [Streptococcus sp.]|nr:accessory Sec-dependent serine-rich glycoprotein adhesin [Streptococcus sp.]